MEPFTPHLAQEIWVALGEKGFIAETNWPDIDAFDSERKETIILPIQIKERENRDFSNT